ETMLRRRVGPMQVAEIEISTAVEPTDARNTEKQIAFGVAYPRRTGEWRNRIPEPLQPSSAPRPHCTPVQLGVAPYDTARNEHLACQLTVSRSRRDSAATSEGAEGVSLDMEVSFSVGEAYPSEGVSLAAGFGHNELLLWKQRPELRQVAESGEVGILFH